MKPRLNSCPLDAKNHIDYQTPPGLMVTKDPSSSEHQAKVKRPFKSAQPAILDAEPLADGCQQQRRGQKQKLVGHLNHSYILGDPEKMGIGMFGHPLHRLEHGLGIVVDLKVTSGKAVRGAFLLLPG